MLKTSEFIIPFICKHLLIFHASSSYKSHKRTNPDKWGVPHTPTPTPTPIPIPSHNPIPDQIHSLKLKIQIAGIRAITDAFIVGGISFFSSVIALGYPKVILSLDITLFSSVTMAALAFFNEMKNEFDREKNM